MQAAVAALRARLTLIRGTGTLGSEFDLDAEETLVGTDGDVSFSADNTLSPIHCRLFVESNGLWVEDLGSHNGTYLRIHRAVQLQDNDMFQVGEQVLRFVRNSPATGVASDEAFCGTPPQPWKFGVYQLLAGGRPGLFVNTLKRSLTLGRDGADVEFPWDPYMSGKHCKITEKDGHFYLVDLDSRNGTFIRLPAGVPVALKPGDFLFFGRQLVRVDPR